MPQIPIKPQIPFLSIKVNIPWGPVKISFMNDNKATQTIGLTSNPLNGLMIFLVTDNSGSVGVYATLQGNFETSISGYQVITIRTIISSDEIESTGFNIPEMILAVEE